MIPGAGIPGVHVVGQISQAVNAIALGALLTVNVSKQAGGIATGGALASGVILQAVSSINAGVAAGGALAQGAVISVSSALIEGLATAGANAIGEDQTVAVSLIEGEAIGTQAGDALGSILVVQASLTPGLALGETGTVRIAGGSAVTRSRRKAHGTVLTINASIIPGTAQVGHEINYYDQHGRLTQTVVLWGLTDEQLRSNEITMAALLDDWDGYALGLYRDAA